MTARRVRKQVGGYSAIVFLAATVLCWLNAALVFLDMVRSPIPVYLVSVSIVCLFLGMGWLVYGVQHHLFRAFEALAAFEASKTVSIRTTLARLRVWLTILALVVVFAMLLCLSGIISRFLEGYPLLG